MSEENYGLTEIGEQETKDLEERIKEAEAVFNDYGLNAASANEVKQYCRYVARNLPPEERVPYNFMIHCNDDNYAEKATVSILDVNYLITGIHCKVRIIEESDITGRMDWETLKSEVEKNEFLEIRRCFSSKDIAYNVRKKSWDNFIWLCEQNPGTCVILCASEQTIAEFFSGFDHLYYRIINHHIYLPKMNVQKINDQIQKRLKEKKFSMSAEFQTELMEYLKTVYPKADLMNDRFVDDMCNRILRKYYVYKWNDKILRACMIPDYRRRTDYHADLDNLVGLWEIKKKIEELDNYMRFYSQGSKSGLNLGNINLHMLFMGNPGTGKTMVARVVAKILYEIGIIPRDTVVEVERKDLVGEYVGQTAPKTKKVIDKAMGGVLFIDEAYSLTPLQAESDYGHEVIETLITAMENNRGRFVVIFAGYENEMRRFIDSNPGISSRIGYKFYFPDYSAGELMQIYDVKMKQIGFVRTEDSDMRVQWILNHMAGRENLGNGRFVANLIERIELKHAARLAKRPAPSGGELRVITLEDIPEIRELN